MGSMFFKRARMAAGALALLASALPAAAFIGNFRGPKVDGDLAVPGLSAKVRVLRDELGIPYIFAQNTPDLIRAQGFVTAQARSCWAMRTWDVRKRFGRFRRSTAITGCTRRTIGAFRASWCSTMDCGSTRRCLR